MEIGDITRSDWLDRFVKGDKGLFTKAWSSYCQLIKIAPTVKYVLHGSLACKRVYGGS
jgi:hypothetical protein